jgi:hypothetical protein
VSLLSPFSSLVMQTPIFLTKLSDESIIFIIDVGKIFCCHKTTRLVKIERQKYWNTFTNFAKCYREKFHKLTRSLTG